MRRRHHQNLYSPTCDCAAHVEGIALNGSLFVQVLRQFVHARQRRVQLFGNLDNISDVIKVGVDHQDIVPARQRCLVLIRGQHWVAGKPRINQHHLVFYFDPKAAVAKPDDVHIGS